MRVARRLCPAMILSLAACQSDSPSSPDPVRPRPTSRPVAAATPTATPTPAGTATPRPTATATTGPTATPSPTPTARPTPSPAPTTIPEPDGPLQPGPVRYVTLRILTVHDGENNRQPPYDDGEGNQVVNYGETVVFDVTPRNIDNKPCETAADPRWIVRDNTNFLQILNSSNPFLLRTRAVGRTGRSGRVHLWAEVDGVSSNHLWVVVR